MAEIEQNDAGISGLALSGANLLRAPLVLIENRLDPTRPAQLYAQPREVVTCSRAEDVPEAFARIEAGTKRGLYGAGFFSYELGYVFEPHLRAFLPEASQLPLIWFGLFEAPKQIPPSELDALFAALGPPAPIGKLVFAHDRAVHMDKVRRAQDYLAAGDAYQINLTFDISFAHDDPLRLYGALRARQPVAHGGLILPGEAALLSVSPELFIEAADGRIMSRPMKGTARRGLDPADDEAQRAALQADPKQRAENVMIVDLMRNDLSRIARIGSVQVPRLFEVETYPSLHTLTSTITAQIRDHLSLHDMMKALFPCGSITGAPKHRAMEIIHELECGPREAYTGSMGTLTPQGALNLNVAIRTARLQDGAGHYGVGGGIVMDSDASGEYDECLLKARVLTDLAADYGLIETLRWSPDEGFVRLERHLARLGRSARQLGFTCSETEIERVLHAPLADWTREGLARRVRLELARDGTLKLTHAPLAPEPDRVMRLCLARGQLDAGDPFLLHKTTRREIYEQAFAAASARGFDEALFLNQRGEVCEAARNSIFIEHGGKLLTPPLTSGLLPGILREEMLETGRASEHLLTLDDLLSAEKLFIGNSLRGLRAAQLAPGII